MSIQQVKVKLSQLYINAEGMEKHIHSIHKSQMKIQVMVIYLAAKKGTPCDAADIRTLLTSRRLHLKISQEAETEINEAAFTKQTLMRY